MHQPPCDFVAHMRGPSRWLAVIDYRGKVVLEHFVAPTSPVSDYRTSTTGLTESHLHSSRPLLLQFLPLTDVSAAGKTISFETARQRVSEAIRDKVVIGHALWNDLSGKRPRGGHELRTSFANTSLRLSVVGLPHLASATRDVALYRPFRNTLRAGQVVGLKTLLWQVSCGYVSTHVPHLTLSRPPNSLCQGRLERSARIRYAPVRIGRRCHGVLTTFRRPRKRARPSTSTGPWHGTGKKPSSPDTGLVRSRRPVSPGAICEYAYRGPE